MDLFSQLTALCHFYMGTNYPFSLTNVRLGYFGLLLDLIHRTICKLHILDAYID
jgi:hypothetical protein